MIESVVRRVPAVRSGWALVVLAALGLVPVQLVAKDKTGETRCLQLGSGSEETAWVITQGNSHMMCGDLADVRDAERARGAGGDIVWFRVGDDRYVIRDDATAAEARRYLETIAALEEQGEEQEEIGEQEAAIGRRQVEVARHDAAEAQRRMEEDLARLGEKVDQEDQRRKELAERELAAARASAGDAELERKRLNERMQVLSRQMEELRARQSELGERQAKQSGFADYLEQAIRDGRAELQ